MTPQQLFNVLVAHPDASNLIWLPNQVLQFDFTYETYTNNGGGEWESRIEAWPSPGGFTLFYVGTFNDFKPSADCRESETLLLTGKISPETVCRAIQHLLVKSHRHRDADGDLVYVGDERLCRGHSLDHLHASKNPSEIVSND